MYNCYNSNIPPQMPFKFPDISQMPCPFQIPLIPEDGKIPQGFPFAFPMSMMPQMSPTPWMRQAQQMPQTPPMQQNQQMPQTPPMPQNQQMPPINPNFINNNMMQMWNNMFRYFGMLPYFNMFRMPGMNPCEGTTQNPQNEQSPQSTQTSMGGVSSMPFQIPGLDLSKLMQIDMSPDKLNVLQKVLDFAFEAYTKEKKNGPEQK